MNTSEVVKLLAKRLSVTQRQAKNLLRGKLDELSDALVRGEKVRMPGLGTFEVVTKKPRQSYIPSKRTRCWIPERKKVRFQTLQRMRTYLKKHWICAKQTGTDD